MKPAVCFYSPLKAPDGAAASGVQRVGALFVRALELAGFAVIVSDLPSTYDGQGDPSRQAILHAEARRAAEAVVVHLRTRELSPAAWFTYHCYYKSPDLVGPIVSRALRCHYLIAEGSYAKKRIGGPWAAHHAEAERALAQADWLLATTVRDYGGLDSVPGRAGRLELFPPFVDCAPFSRPVSTPISDKRIRLISAGSMRDARKLASFHRIFDSLSTLEPAAYSLTIAGDGPGRRELEARAEPFRASGAKIDFLGTLPPAEMPALFAGGDLFVWPGIGEAYGLTYLEAQAAGLPVLAEDSGGVRACVLDGVSGVLVPANCPDVFAQKLRELCETSDLRRTLGRSAQAWVWAERSLARAAERLAGLIGERAA